jgi:hypothetical protein
MWARRDTRFDVYPQNEPLVRVRVEPTGWGPHEVRLSDEKGIELREPYVLVRDCAMSQHCSVTEDHEHCPRETTLGTKACECPCHVQRP